MEADKKLLANMEDTADCILRFRLAEEHFPEPGQEQNRTIEYLQKKLKANPYSSTAILNENEKRPCKIRFILEPTLNESMRQSWLSKPPSNWTAEPGTITVILSAEKSLLIWGAGADHRPIYDSQNNKYFITWRELN